MDVKAARRVPERFNNSVLHQRGQPYGKKVCKYWLAGMCNRHPCAFLHIELPHSQPLKQPNQLRNVHSNHTSFKIKRNIYHDSSKTVPKTIITQNNTWRRATVPSNVVVTSAPQSKLCKYWVTGNCVHGDKCKDLHSWFCGSGFSMMTNLEGHTKAVSGVALPSGSDKLFSASIDGALRVWDCHSGQCVNNIKLEGEIQCLLSEGPWVFAGVSNVVKAWNIQTQTEHVLSGPNGLVHSLATSDDMLFAGIQDGSILAWKSNFGPDCPELVTALKGHSQTVLALVVGAQRLFSGSKDNTIRIWGLESMQCQEIVTGHTDFVMSLLCWDNYLLSGSLDNTVKVWATSESGKLNVVYEIKEESGVIALRGIVDAEDKPILLCSNKEGTLRLYDLPSFVERGRIFAKREIQTIEVGWCGGHFFTGDSTGQLSVWRLDGEFKVKSL